MVKQILCDLCGAVIQDHKEVFLFRLEQKNKVPLYDNQQDTCKKCYMKILNIMIKLKRGKYFES